MARVLVVSHSAKDRDLVLWKSVLEHNPLVDLVIPILESEKSSGLQETLLGHPRVVPLPAIEPFGKGHSSMWIKGLPKLAASGKYDLVHVAFEPWALIPQAICGKVPTVVHGAESVVREAPLLLRVRRVGIGRVLKKAAGVLAWGQTSLDAFREVGLPETTPQGVIPVGIPDPSFFKPVPLDLAPGPLRVLFVGRLVPEKGILTLINAAGTLNRLIHLRVFGGGPLQNSLADLASAYPDVILSVEGIGTAEQVAAGMAWSHVVVIPSEPHESWKEQWGRVAVEAMLSGRPTVVSDSGELPLLVAEPKLVFPAGDTVALAAILERLDENRQELSNIGEKLRESAERFSPDKLVLELDEFWNQVERSTHRH